MLHSWREALFCTMCIPSNIRHSVVVRVPKCYDWVMCPPTCTRMYSQNKKHDLHYSSNCTHGRNYLTITSPLPHPCNVLSNIIDVHSLNRSTICTMTGTAHTAGTTSCYPSFNYIFTLVYVIYQQAHIELNSTFHPSLPSCHPSQ